MRATQPTVASAAISKVPPMSGGTPLDTAAFKPLPIPGHTPQMNIRENNAPVNHFNAPGALPHMMHPNSGVGGPSSGSPMTVHVPGVK